MAMTPMTVTRPHQDSTELLLDPPALRARAGEQGYFCFKGLLPAADVLAVRRQILETCQHHGFLDDQAPLENGIARNDFFIHESDADPVWLAYYKDILKLHDFHALAQHENLLAVLETLIGEPVLPHSRNISMALFPRGVETTTPAHQDFNFIGGTEETWTVWIPCGDCPMSLGGLAIVPGSNHWGFKEHAAYDPTVPSCLDFPADSVWAVSELTTGDVLMFKSTTVHQGVANPSPNQIRLSLDFRYQPRSHPVRSDSLEPHMQILTWDEVYQDWPADDPLKYYWKDWPLNIVEETAAQG